MDAEIHLNYSIQQSSENLPVLSLFQNIFFLLGMHFSGAYSRLMLALIGVFNRVLWILKNMDPYSIYLIQTSELGSAVSPESVRLGTEGLLI